MMRRSVLTRLLRRLRREDGFTMVVVMGAMMSIMALSAVALAAAGGDNEGTAYDRESKQAYSAAEAGIADYLYHLNQDNSYWAKCDQVPDPSAVNQRGSVTKRRAVSGTTADYAIELLPANGKTSCSTTDASGSMLDSASGTFRIRSTGRVPTGNGSYAKRAIITTFKRRGFLDFLYFTDLETSDPAWYQLDTRGRQTGNPDASKNVPDLMSWASTNCAKYWRDGRGSQTWYDSNGDGPDDGQIFWFDNNWYPWPTECSQIQFAPGDKINGPLHTNDELLVCGSPTFGRASQDKIEMSADAPGWRSSCAGSSPNFVGTPTPKAPILAMPPSNGQLKKIVQPAYKFTGTTTIDLTGGAAIKVTNQTMGLSNANMATPPNGVIYVQDGNCGQGYLPLAPYGAPQGCGDVYVKGPYNTDLTIAAEKDIVITGDIKRSADRMLGLIANNFVRVYHPVKNLDVSGWSVSCTNDTGTMQNVQIDAAILALQH
ncbi:MAG: hypothetical protein M3301_03475, partial [Chloroflexota bacterium]|nr:hypothetical protein [Chloroflexota bacterium]